MGACQTSSNKQSSKQEVADKDVQQNNNNQNKNLNMNIKVDQSMFVNLQTGKIKDQYNIGKELGTGSYGTVLEVFDKKTGIQRAMKCISKLGLKPEDVTKLLDEVNILKELDHPNIIKIYEFYQDQNKYYLITEYCEGGQLFDKIVEQKNFNEKIAAGIIKQILSSLLYLNKQGIVHRDLKPENILLDFKNSKNKKAQTDKDLGSIKIIDFGTACQIPKDKQLNLIIGTPYYIAPEVLKQSYNQQCDVWSVGIILYIMLCGYPPFTGENEKEIFYAIKHSKLEFDDEDWAHVSAPAKDIVQRMLIKDPTKRITVEKAFEHDWLKTNVEKNIMDKKVLDNIQNFHSNNKLQQAIFNFINSQLMSQLDKQQMIQTFKALDKNGDGTLSRQELLEGYRQMYPHLQNVEEIVNNIMASVDGNNSGIIDFSEFCIAAFNREQLIKKEKIQQAFNQFDKDGDQKISKVELQKMLGGVKMQYIDELVQMADKDGDGEINFDEFCTIINNQLIKKK